MSRFGKVISGATLVATMTIVAPPVSAQVVNLDFKLWGNAVDQAAWLNARITDDDFGTYIVGLPMPAGPESLMAENLRIPAFVTYEVGTSPLSSGPAQATYGGSSGITVIREGQTIDLVDTSAIIIARHEPSDDRWMFGGIVHADAAGGALDFSLATPLSHEIDLTDMLPYAFGSVPPVSELRIRASYDSLRFDGAGFSFLSDATTLGSLELPSYDALLSQPLQPFFASLTWKATLQLEVIDAGYSDVEFSAAREWVSANLRGPEVTVNYNLSMYGLTVSAVPEPASVVMWLCGLALLIGASRRRSRL